MDSDREVSSDSENEEKEMRSPSSGCSNSPGSSVKRGNSPKSPVSPTSKSRSESPDSAPHSLSSRPRSPKSPDDQFNYGTNSPLSNNHSGGPRSPSPANSSSSNTPRNGKSSPNGDNTSAKSHSSSSRKSKSISPDRSSVASDKSDSSRDSRKARKAANLEDGNSSDSSASSFDSSSRKNKNISKNFDTQPEEISDGDMESDGKSDVENKQDKKKEAELNMNHDDLSDVSDLDESIGGPSDNDVEETNIDINNDNVQERDKKVQDKTRTDDGEEQLDFEAEDGECAETDISKEKDEKSKLESGECVEESGEIDEGKKGKSPAELEEGEVTDEDDARPEETEPRPVCRFFSRGQCTWGASCRFLHPGVTDKGNYTMFELIRPVVPGEYGRDERLYGGARPEPPPIESAWERGLRTAKEMLRKSIKRKEQDIDFEEKKMNLSLTQEELDKENGYYARAPSPEPRYMSIRHPVPAEYPAVRVPPEEYYNRRQVLYEPEYAAVPARERVRSYRELPSHRMPDYYNNKYEEEAPTNSTNKTRKPKREVIVQRVEERAGRGDEWSDPWMRSKSPGARKGRKRSYSSGSSYSSSSSSRSSTGSSRSSYKSRSRSPRHKRSSRGHRNRHGVSPSIIVSERKAANERAALMNPPAPRKKAPSPSMMRAGAQNPPAPSKVDQFGRTRSKLAVAAALARVKRQRSSHSSSDSSGSTSSDSDSSGSSSSSSRDGSPPRRTTNVDLALALKAKAIDALKNSSEKRQIKLNLKNPVAPRKAADVNELSRKVEMPPSKKRIASPPPTDKNASNKKATTRREELLKQLKAVEDAIAKKRSKVN